MRAWIVWSVGLLAYIVAVLDRTTLAVSGLGFLASLIVMQAMGAIIGAAGGYSFESFRIAWTVQYGVWALAVVGILITRTKTRRALTPAHLTAEASQRRNA